MSHKLRVERTRKHWDNASTKLTDWAIANGFGRVKYSDLRLAFAGHVVGLQLLQAEKNARAMLDAAQDAAVDAGKAYRGTFGLLSWY
jgi:hypothetical protein